ncbi:MAG: peptide chain release factor N(5)-glutamine methyltransferase [Proteobacteria bacterium]|nr:peptide chain release factor N(5)-glutamine methyltransferase [Pseudomonadota bacterium]
MTRIIPGLKTDASIAEAQRMMAQAFRLAGLDSPEADARLLLGHALRLDRARLLSQSDRLLEAREIEAVQGLAARRLRHEPVARILGRKEFWNLTLQVSDAVLVPRPETETVVELALDLIAHDGPRDEPLRILDIGTGTGALLLALLSELPKASGVGTDVSMRALEIARVNAAQNELAARTQFVCCNLADGVGGPFDLVVSNPPYIARAEIETLQPEVRDYDPALALDGGTDGLDFYRAIAREAARLLAPDGHLVVELGAGQEAPVARLFQTAGLTVEPARPDLAGIPRALPAMPAAKRPS